MDASKNVHHIIFRSLGIRWFPKSNETMSSIDALHIESDLIDRIIMHFLSEKGSKPIFIWDFILLGENSPNHGILSIRNEDEFGKLKDENNLLSSIIQKMIFVASNMNIPDFIKLSDDLSEVKNCYRLTDGTFKRKLQLFENLSSELRLRNSAILDLSLEKNQLIKHVNSLKLFEEVPRKLLCLSEFIHERFAFVEKLQGIDQPILFLEQNFVVFEILYLKEAVSNPSQNYCENTLHRLNILAESIVEHLYYEIHESLQSIFVNLDAVENVTNLCSCIIPNMIHILSLNDNNNIHMKKFIESCLFEKIISSNSIKNSKSIEELFQNFSSFLKKVLEPSMSHCSITSIQKKKIFLDILQPTIISTLINHIMANFSDHLTPSNTMKFQQSYTSATEFVQFLKKLFGKIIENFDEIVNFQPLFDIWNVTSFYHIWRMKIIQTIRSVDFNLSDDNITELESWKQFNRKFEDVCKKCFTDELILTQQLSNILILYFQCNFYILNIFCSKVNLLTVKFRTKMELSGNTNWILDEAISYILPFIQIFNYLEYYIHAKYLDTFHYFINSTLPFVKTYICDSTIDIEISAIWKQKLVQSLSQIRCLISTTFLSTIRNDLKQVQKIPRIYLKTKRSFPTSPSQYIVIASQKIAKILDVIHNSSAFIDEYDVSIQILFLREIIHEYVSYITATFKVMETAIEGRLTRYSKISSENDPFLQAEMSDDIKMKHQIKLDLHLFCDTISVIPQTDFSICDDIFRKCDVA